MRIRRIIRKKRRRRRRTKKQRGKGWSAWEHFKNTWKSAFGA